MITAPQTRRLRLTRPLDLRLTLAPTRIGKGDPCTRLRTDEAFRATRTPDGPATVHLVVRADEVAAEAWGPGADWALDQLPVLVGECDIDDFRTDDPLVAELHRRTPGLRIGATHRILESLLPAVCAQKVSSYEAKRAYRQIMEAYGEAAPGPPQLDLVVPPHPRTLASTSHQDLHPIGLEQARADVIRRAAARAATIEALVDADPEVAEQRLRSLVGVGVWTAAMVRGTALGDPDAVPLGDHRMKHLVAYVFTGDRRGTDAQMLELLEPFRGHRGRVVRLIEASGLGPPTA
jgi:3-methyladenine DNA glycosylase/8-oxoguanine DNA glycosylase